MQLNDILSKLNDVMYTYVLIIMLVGVGIYFTIRTRGVQLRLLKDGLKTLIEKSDRVENEDGKKRVSSFQALMISTASRVGTGNIAGIATAIAAGGPGALFWMILAAFFGMATKYSEGLLAVKYRTVDEDGDTLWADRFIT